jgi:hypothetical protein
MTIDDLPRSLWDATVPADEERYEITDGGSRSGPLYYVLGGEVLPGQNREGCLSWPMGVFGVEVGTAGYELLCGRLYFKGRVLPRQVQDVVVEHGCWWVTLQQRAGFEWQAGSGWKP